MNRQAINERISAWFEPKPTVEMPQETVNNKRSAKHAWVFKTWDWRWHARDWDTDEAANAMLLEAMAAANSYVWIEWDINEWSVMWKPTTLENNDCSIEYNHKDRKTCVVLAFLAFAKLEAVDAII